MAAGIALGTGWSIADSLFGDVPMAPSAAARHAAALGVLGGGAGLRVTSGAQSFALGGADSKHLTGQAIDVAGSGLNRYTQAARSLGAAAKMHGNHAQSSGGTWPWRRPWPAGGQGVATGGRFATVSVYGDVYGISDLKAVVKKSIQEVDAANRERARRDLRGRRPWQS